MREGLSAAALFGLHWIEAIKVAWKRRRFIDGQLASGVTEQEAQDALREVQEAGLIP